jgi:hypothetical protein
LRHPCRGCPRQADAIIDLAIDAVGVVPPPRRSPLTQNAYKRQPTRQWHTHANVADAGPSRQSDVAGADVLRRWTLAHGATHRESDAGEGQCGNHVW